MTDQRRDSFDSLIAGPGCMLLVNLHSDGITGIPFLVTRGKSLISLVYGYNLARPTDDAVTDAEGVRATLIFGPDYADTFIPWKAVLAVQSLAQGCDAETVSNVDAKQKLRLV